MTGEAPKGSDARPLAGRTVLVTRARHQAAGLADPLRSLGAEVLVAPVIDTVDPEDWGPADKAIASLPSYDWLVLTSANAVDRFFGRMKELGQEVGAASALKVAVVGPATAERLDALGIRADVVPADYRAEGLVEAFAAQGVGEGRRILLPRAAAAREVLPESLRAAGAEVDVVPVYRTVAAKPDPAIVGRLRDGDVDVITFTSPSTVRHFLDWLSSAGVDTAMVAGSAVAASIGPVSTRALEARGWTTIIEAEESTAASLVRAIASLGAGAQHH